jgi:hypothetical protein
MKNWIVESWRSLSRWASKGRKTAAYRTERVAELPEKLRDRRLYVMADPRPWAVAMLCPCGCRSVIQLSLLETDSPRWQLSVDRKGVPTLAPSVHRTRGCKSHFFLRAGRIDWCNL